MRAIRTLSLFCLAVLFSAPRLLQATTYHVNRGTRWHVGNSNAHRSDANLATDQKIGPSWEQPFKLSSDDRVEVEIRHVWGLDQRATRAAVVRINDEVLGEFSAADLSSYRGLRPVALKGGQNYVLHLEALGPGKDQDWAFEDVIIRTQSGAEVILTGPPEIHTNLAGACDKLDVNQGLGYGLDSNPNFRLQADAAEFSSSEVLARLSPGQSASLYVSVRDGVRADRISQSLEFLVEQQDVPSGWVLSFERNGEGMIQGNMLKAGRYTTRLFSAPGYLPRQWNLVKVSYCNDNTVHLYLNGKALKQSFTEFQGDFFFRIRSQGLVVDTYKAPLQVASR